MRQSIKLIDQCLIQMPKGDFILSHPKIVPPPRPEMKESMEAMIHHFKLYSEGFHVPSGEIYQAVEAPKGEFCVSGS